MTRATPIAMLLAAAAFVSVARPTFASPITPAAFGGLAVVESFEALALGANVRIGMGTSLLEPGTVSAFSFASGVTLSAPVPNPGVLNRGAFVHDLARATDVQNNWGATGVVNDPTDVPFGDAYLGAFHPTGAGTASFTLSFATPVDRVGAYVTGYAGTTITMQVYDMSGVLLESGMRSAVSLGAWGTNFVGIEQPGRIGRVVFTGTDFGVDGFTFEDSPVLVPEPGTLHTLMLGLLGLWGLATLGRERSATAARVRAAIRTPGRSA